MKEIVKFIQEGLKITSNTKVNKWPKYDYHPKTKEELQDLINQLIKERGNEGDFNDIDTSKITDMSDLFDSIDKFNGDISNWDVSNVTSMTYMFYGCESFNQPLNTWNVSKVVKMSSMFCNCKSFNQNISKQNVSKVNDFGNMFYKCPIKENYKPKFS